MRFLETSALCLGIAQAVYSQGTQDSLGASLSRYPDLSAFNDILDTYPDLIGTVLDGKPDGVTVLVPTNEAFEEFLEQSNSTDVSQIKLTDLQKILRYHVLDAPLTTANFTVPNGITVPTKLKDVENNLRTPGPAMIDLYGADATGQVLYISSDPIGKAKFRVRQSLSGDNANLRAGLGQTAILTGLDGVWDGGSFQAINSILAPPTICSTTIKTIGDNLKSLHDALGKAELWKALDSHPNITCLGPNTAAFGAAGNPEESLNKTDLTNALLFHTLPSVEYTNFLQDGAEYVSLANLTVRVTIRDNDIYFNDAKVISPNVLTNNGLIHVLDRVMSPNATGPPPSSSSPTSTTAPSTSTTSSSTSSSSSSPTTTPNAASVVSGSKAGFGLMAVVAGAAVLM